VRIISLFQFPPKRISRLIDQLMLTVLPLRERWEGGPERHGRQAVAGEGEIPQAFLGARDREHPIVATAAPIYGAVVTP